MDSSIASSCFAKQIEEGRAPTFATQNEKQPNSPTSTNTGVSGSTLVSGQQSPVCKLMLGHAIYTRK